MDPELSIIDMSIEKNRVFPSKRDYDDNIRVSFPCRGSWCITVVIVWYNTATQKHHHHPQNNNNIISTKCIFDSFSLCYTYTQQIYKYIC